MTSITIDSLVENGFKFDYETKEYKVYFNKIKIKDNVYITSVVRNNKIKIFIEHPNSGGQIPLNYKYIEQINNLINSLKGNL